MDTGHGQGVPWEREKPQSWPPRPWEKPEGLPLMSPLTQSPIPLLTHLLQQADTRGQKAPQSP